MKPLRLRWFQRRAPGKETGSESASNQPRRVRTASPALGRERQERLCVARRGRPHGGSGDANSRAPQIEFWDEVPRISTKGVFCITQGNLKTPPIRYVAPGS